MTNKKLGEPFYLNILLQGDTENYPIWIPVFDNEYAGSARKKEAVKLRKEYQKILNDKYKVWPIWKFKTVKIVEYWER